jgi:molybdopterin-synthase adenylyltransferase
MTIQEAIRSISKTILDPTGRETFIMEDRDAEAAALRFGLTIHDIYMESLRIGIYPCRYLRNRGSISCGEQLTLGNRCVAVVGAGGLGGHVVLLLARAGLGHLVVVDNDRFDETNLNRQALSSGEALGRFKAEEAARVVGNINPGVRVTPHPLKIDGFNAAQLLIDADVVVDALDNIPDRLVVEDASRSLGIPLVHGALAGFKGQVMTIFPEDPGFEKIYGPRRPDQKNTEKDRTQGPEAVLGVPTPTPALIAALQAAEVIKIVLKRGNLFRNGMLRVDLETGDMHHFTFV